MIPSLGAMLLYLALVVLALFVLGAIQDVVYFFQGHESVLGDYVDAWRGRRR